VGKKDAELTIGADASAVERVAGAAKAAWKDAGESLTASIGQAAKSVITSLADVALASGKVNFSGQHEQVKAFEASSARLAVAMGSDFEKIRTSVETTGVAIGKRPQEVAAWISAVGKLTGNFEGAGEAIRGVAELAAQTGRTVEDYQGLATVLGTVGGVAGETSTALGSIAAQAKDLKTTGGVAAFAQQIEGLGGTISQFSIKSSADLLRVTAMAGELGKGLSAQAAGRVQSQAFGAIAQDPLRWERYLGRKITDSHGQVEKPEDVLREITEKTKRRYGKDSQRVLQLNFGAETGAAMFNADFKEASRAAGLAPDSSLKAAQGKWLGSDAGKRDVADAELGKASRDLMGSSTLLGRASDALQRFASHNPITSTLLSSAASTGVGLFLAKYGGSVATLMGGKGAGGAAGGVFDLATKGSIASSAGGKLLGTAAKVLLPAAIAYGLATAARDEFEEAADERFAAKEKESAEVNKNQLKMRAAVRQSKIARLEAGGMSHGMALYASEKVGALSSVAAGGETAIAADIRKHDPRLSEDSVMKLAKAIADSMKNVKFAVTTRPDTPVEVSAAGAKSSAAGGQGH
jgi:hypothetical protein